PLDMRSFTIDASKITGQPVTTTVSTAVTANGQPLANAQILLRSLTSGVADVNGTTDANGNISLSFMTGRYGANQAVTLANFAVLINGDTVVASQQFPLDMRSFTIDASKITGQPTFSKLSGKLTNSKNAPMPHEQITARAGDKVYVVTTDENGNYQMPGNFQIGVYGPNGAINSYTFIFSVGAEQVATMRFSGATVLDLKVTHEAGQIIVGDLAGTVVDPNGVAVTATMVLTPVLPAGTGLPVVTEGIVNGSYEISNAAAVIYVETGVATSITYQVTIDDIDEGTMTLLAGANQRNFVVSGLAGQQESAGVQGSVRGPNKEIIDGSTITFVSSLEGVPEFTAPINAGTFNVPKLPAAIVLHTGEQPTPVTWQVSIDGLSVNTEDGSPITSTTFSAGINTLNLEVIGLAGQVLYVDLMTGLVNGPRGQNATGVIRFTPQIAASGLRAFEVPVADGVYEIPEMPDVLYQVKGVRMPVLYDVLFNGVPVGTSLTVSTGRQNFMLQGMTGDKTLANVEGTVTDQNGNPVVGAVVNVRPELSDLYVVPAYTTITDNLGGYRLSNVIAAEYPADGVRIPVKFGLAVGDTELNSGVIFQEGANTQNFSITVTPGPHIRYDMDRNGIVDINDYIPFADLGGYGYIVVTMIPDSEGNPSWFDLWDFLNNPPANSYDLNRDGRVDRGDILTVTDVTPPGSNEVVPVSRNENLLKPLDLNNNGFFDPGDAIIEANAIDEALQAIIDSSATGIGSGAAGVGAAEGEAALSQATGSMIVAQYSIPSQGTGLSTTGVTAFFADLGKPAGVATGPAGEQIHYTRQDLTGAASGKSIEISSMDGVDVLHLINSPTDMTQIAVIPRGPGADNAPTIKLVTDFLSDPLNPQTLSQLDSIFNEAATNASKHDFAVSFMPTYVKGILTALADPQAQPPSAYPFAHVNSLVADMGADALQETEGYVRQWWGELSESQPNMPAMKGLAAKVLAFLGELTTENAAALLPAQASPAAYAANADAIFAVGLENAIPRASQLALSGSSV
ncbi:MAG: carboxypeptidase-like regulatory domain-containing protein, partial [Candidatus Omnitrophota bacterium]